MNEVKTFPLKFIKEFHEVIKMAAEKNHKSMNKFILEAIEEKLQRESNK